MKFGIDWSQASTKRGAVLSVFGMAGIVGYFTGHDPAIIIAAGVTFAGGLGLAVKD